jgi:DNA-binding transcriptional regulator YhcF (GntR family)
VARAAFEGAVREAKSLGLSREETHELMTRSIARWYETENE